MSHPCHDQPHKTPCEARKALLIQYPTIDSTPTMTRIIPSQDRTITIQLIISHGELEPVNYSAFCKTGLAPHLSQPSKVDSHLSRPRCNCVVCVSSRNVEYGRIHRRYSGNCKFNRLKMFFETLRSHPNWVSHLSRHDSLLTSVCDGTPYLKPPVMSDFVLICLEIDEKLEMMAITE